MSLKYTYLGSDILQNFYPVSLTKSNTNIAAITTYFNINSTDISNNYVGIGTNSNIPVSYLYHNYNFFTGITPIGDLFELNLPVFITGTINDHYKMFPNNGGLLIQILKNTTLSFRYNVDCSFCMVGGGGGGGYLANSNAGGGGGAGELVQGSINNYTANIELIINIGNGGSPYASGLQTTITYTPLSTTYQIYANGGGWGAYGKGNGESVTGSSAGGGGGYSNSGGAGGTHTTRSIPTNNIFNSMTSSGNNGARGNDQNNDSGGGGGGGGAGAAAVADPTNEAPGIGGAGMTITFGSKSFDLAGGGGGGGRENGTGPSPQGVGGAGGLGGGGAGGGYFLSTSQPAPLNGNGVSGTANTGGGGGGGENGSASLGNIGTGGAGGSGTVIFYILPSGVTI